MLHRVRGILALTGLSFFPAAVLSLLLERFVRPRVPRILWCPRPSAPTPGRRRSVLAPKSGAPPPQAQSRSRCGAPSARNSLPPCLRRAEHPEAASTCFHQRLTPRRGCAPTSRRSPRFRNPPKPSLPRRSRQSWRPSVPSPRLRGPRGRDRQPASCFRPTCASLTASRPVISHIVEPRNTKACGHLMANRRRDDRTHAGIQFNPSPRFAARMRPRSAHPGSSLRAP